MAQAAPYNIGSPYNIEKAFTASGSMGVDDDIASVTSASAVAITLPKANLCTQQNRRNTKRLVNLGSSTGVATVTAASGDTVRGRAAVPITDSCVMESDGIKTWSLF